MAQPPLSGTPPSPGGFSEQRARGSPVAHKRFAKIYVNVLADLRHGEEVRIFGPSSALGSDNPELGVRLCTTPSLYPVWFTPAALSLPIGEAVTFKLCVYAGGALARMEDRAAPRRVVPRNASATVHCTFGGGDVRVVVTADAPASSPGTAAPPADLLQVPKNRRSVSASDAAVAYAASARASTRGEPDVVRRALAAVGDAGGEPAAAALPPLPPAAPPQAAAGAGLADLAGPGGLAGLGETETETGHREDDDEEEDGLRLPPELAWQRSSRRLSMNTARLRASGHELPSTEKRARKFESGSRIHARDGLVVVCRHLPVVLARDEESGKWRATWDAENPLVLQGAQKLRVTYVGGLRQPVAAEDEAAVTRALQRLRCTPVLLPADLAARFDHFSDGTLWPVFHNVTDVYGPRPTRWWDSGAHKGAYAAYADANRLFCNRVVEVWNEGDLIWAHDYQLLLLPSFLSRRLPSSTVGLHLHIPFPPSELFRSLSMRDHLLHSMLNADLIGFNLFEYARHFLTSCRRVLGLAYEALPGGTVGIDNNGRTVVVSASHIGMEPARVHDLLARPSVEEAAMGLRQRFQGKKIVAGVDGLHRMMALPIKMAAIRAFFEAHPEWRGRVVFVQYGVVGDARADDAEAARRVVAAEVARINAAFGEGEGEGVVYEERAEPMRMEERLALWVAADVMVHAPARDAYSLTPLEFVHAQGVKVAAGGPRPPGALVLSEFASAARVLVGSLHANPFFSAEMVSRIEEALSMPDEHRRARYQRDRSFLETHTTSLWAQNVVLDLKRCAKESSVKFQGVGLGLGFRLLGMNTHFAKLPTDAVQRAYRRSSRRAFFIDYGGTLVPDGEGFAKAPALPRHVAAALARLADDRRNTVFVLSGKPTETLATAFRGVRGVGLAAEHGFYIHVSGDTDEDGEVRFEQRCTLDTSWSEVASAIMDCYAERTNGTYVEKNGCSQVWRFQDADPEYGSLQAAELHDHLTGVLKHFPVQVLRGAGYVEVRPRDVNKGTTVDHILAMLEVDGHSVDFVFAVGDDTADEYMFSHADAAHVASRGAVFTCTVGMKPSGAQFYVHSDDEVVELLSALGGLSASQAGRTQSMPDLAAMSSLSSSPPDRASLADTIATPRRSKSRLVTSHSVQAFVSSESEGEEEEGIFF